MAPNRLARETSPYLRQHALNPVDWYPWGPEALERARREDRPLFLSVGYSACHWCHVMAHESFEDLETAALLNDLFVPVKVDREERPDLDALYMRAVLILHGHGGWPLSVFLTPDLKPFFGGTYFPRESRFGMTGFPDVLRALSRAYRGRRDELEATAAQLVAAVARSFEAPEGRGTPGPASADAARRALLSRFDETHGGFGRGPKFPQPPLLEFLLDEAARTGDRSLAQRVLLTLGRMEAGGVRDQVGGGFHRYSVDGLWHVPHYEKMLYDNAQLASLYFRAGALSGDGELRRVGEEVLADLRRTMAAPGGGFVAALDADSEGEEGRFYLWSRSDLESALGPAEGALVGDLYGVTSDGEALEERTLHRLRPWSEAARDAGVPEAALRHRVGAAVGRLREAREGRVHPGVDTKVLTDWNALAATAFLDGYATTGAPEELATGLGTLDLLEARCLSGPTLHHVWDGQAAKVPGFLADYAYLAQAQWKAFEATGDPARLGRASALAGAALERFADPSGRLYDTPPGEGGDLLLPVRDADDGVLPSALSVLAQVLWVLDRVTGEVRWRQALDRLMEAESGALAEAPGARPLLAGLAALRARPSAEIVVAAPCAEAAASLLQAARRCPCPRALVVPYFADRWAEEEAGRLPLLRGRRREAGAAAFVCTGGTCRLPVEDPAQLAELLKEDPAWAFAEAPEN